MPDRLRQAVLTLAAIGTLLLGGCAEQSASISVWIADDMVNLTDQTPPIANRSIFEPETNTICLFAAANETISFQIIIDAGITPLHGMRVNFDDFLPARLKDLPADQKQASENIIDANNIHAFRMLPVTVSSCPSWYLRLAERIPSEESFYDPLVPINARPGGAPFKIAPGGRLALWVDVYVPHRVLPGYYTSRATATFDDGSKWVAGIDLRVHDFILPDARSVSAIGGFDHRTIFRTFIRSGEKPYTPAHLDRRRPLIRRGLVIIRQLMTLSHAHRLDLFDREIHPVFKRDRSGKIGLEWADYDAIVTPYLSGSAFGDRIGCPAWPVPFHEHWPSAENYGGIETKAYEAAASKLLAECHEHFAKTPEFNEQLFYWPYRGEVNSTGYDRHTRLSRIIRATDSNTPILSQLSPDPPESTKLRLPDDFQRLTDVFALRGEWLDPNCSERFASSEHPLMGVWISPGTAPYLPGVGIYASSSDVRALPWFAMKYKTKGLFFPEVLDWSGDMTIAEPDSEGKLFYPGTIVGLEQILPSVRLKRLRRGLQDVVYLWLLTQHQRMGIAKAMTDAMVRYGGLDAAGDHYSDPRADGWVKDGASWRTARRLLAEEVEAVVRPGSSTRKRFLADQLAWKQFDEQVHTVRVEQVRSRVTSPARKKETQHPRTTRLRASVMLDVYNEYSRATNVLFKIESLPDGWEAVHTEHKLDPMYPAAREVVVLTAEANQIPTGSDGKLPLPVSISTDLNRRKEMTARIAFVRAGRITNPPRIDGRLDDWPMRYGNTAGSFKLIGRRGMLGEGLAERKTLVFVLADQKNLYVAFRCEEPNISAMTANPNNMIRYEQLMACGEDLVEIILDPGMTAKATPDLYHIVVKANGVTITERGVRSDPPLGEVRSWAPAVSVAVGWGKNHWVVELAIPRSAFGKGDKQQFWGINFTRFATQGREASSWSEAARYFYDPRNLGTMYVSPLE